MRAEMRRVDTVRLSARSEALVRRGSVLLEDALRTASLPEEGPGRVLVVRRLPLGVIRGHQSPASLALVLERQVRALASLAVHAGEEVAAHREAVFFRDDAEPATALAGLLARGEPVGAWFWPLAVPGFQPGLPREEALRRVLAAALGTSAGPAAAVRLVEALHEEGGLDGLLAALRWQEGPALVRAFASAVPEPVVPAASASLEELAEAVPSASLRASVARWVEAWGAGDARAVWLSAVALVMARRVRLVDVRLFDRAARIAAGLASGQGVRAQRTDTREVVAPTRAASTSRHAPERERGRPSPVLPKEPLADTALAGPTSNAPVPGVDFSGAETPSSSTAPGDSVAMHSPATAEHCSPATAEHCSPATAEHCSPATAEQRSPATAEQRSPATAEQRSPAAAEQRSPAAAEQRSPDRVPAGPDLPARIHAARTPERLDADGESSLPEWPDVPRPTAVGGLLFLVPILQRLGMATLLEENPDLIEFDVTDRLLSLVAERLSAPAADPSRAVFAAHARGLRPARCAFTLPERLRAQVAKLDGAPLTFGTEDSEARVVRTDLTERLPLAVTYGEAPGAQPRPLPPLLRAEDDLDLLLRGLLTAVRRWCRRRARIGLRDLVSRPARITATRTHVDVLFDIQQTDLRVRSAGLDLDPGWVPWLGRVVRFHYLYGEQ